MMNYSLRFVFDFCIAIISLVVLFDLVLKCRVYNRLFVGFILIILTIFFNIITIYFVSNSSFLYNIFQFYKITSVIGSLMVLSNLYYNIFNKYIKIGSFLLYGIFIIRTLYFFYYKIKYIPDDYIFYTYQIYPFYNKAENVIFNGVRVFILLLTLVSFYFFWKNIVISFSNDNFFNKKLKLFTNLILISPVFIILLYFLKTYFIFLSDYKLNLGIQFIIQLYTLLVIFYRPIFLNIVTTPKLAIINKFNFSGDFALNSSEFDQAFFIELFYINTNSNISTLANKLNVNKDNLAIYINNRFGLTLYDLVNKHRIEYFVELIKNPNFKNYTIDALSKEAGFVSRNAIYKPFKKFHGGNPSDLIDLYS